MRKQITLILLLMVLGGGSAWAQYTFNFQVRQNDGSAVDGANSYLTTNETTTAPGSRTRLVTQTRTRTVRLTQYRTTTGNNTWNASTGLTQTYSGDKDANTGAWSNWGTATNGAWTSWSWEAATVLTSGLSFGTSPTSSVNTTETTGDSSETDPIFYHVGYSTTPTQNSDWYYEYGGYNATRTQRNSSRYRYTTVTETEGRRSVQSQEGTQNSTNAAVNWYFVPVPYTSTTEGEVTTVTGEPGWYYIQNTMTGAYIVMGDDGVPTVAYEVPTTNNGNGAKWRLVKVAVGTAANEDIMHFKLVSKLGYDVPSTGGTLMHRDAANTATVSGSTTYNSTNSVFLLTPTSASGDGLITRNEDQEIFSNYVAVSATDATNTVWTTALPIPTIDANWNRKGGDINHELGYELAPIAYGGSNASKVIYGEYASGLEEGDGYYFTRMPNGESLYQNTGTYTATTNTKLLFSVWLRGIMTAEQLASLTPGDDGYYTVGTATFTYVNNATRDFPLRIRASAINTDANHINDPSAWDFITVVVDGRITTNTNIVKKLTVTAAFGDNMDGAYLDVDNANLELLNTAVDASFIYKSSGNTSQSPQDVPQFEHTLFVRQTTSAQNISAPLITSTKSFPYYRWYKKSNAGNEVFPTEIANARGMYDTQAAVTTRNSANGIIAFLTNRNDNPDGDENIHTQGYRANFQIPSTAQDPTFFTGPNSVVYCDMSSYKDYNWSGTTTTFTEPSLSLRNVFRFYKAEDLAKAISDSLASGSVLEYYDLEAPAASTGTASRLRLTPKHDIVVPKNYWTYNENRSTLYASNRFRWYRIPAGENGAAPANLYTTGSGTEVAPLTNSKYLQITTTGKAGTVEYYAVEAYTYGSRDASVKRVAVFKVTYKDRDGEGGVGPQRLVPSSNPDTDQDIFKHITDKKLIIEKNFDQLGTLTPPLPNAFPSQQTEASIYGMGVKPLKTDETSYGFTSPLYYAGNGVTSTGSGSHINHRAPFWSEYGFPQQINGVTDWTSVADWWNGNTSGSPTIVNDITFLRTGTRGNMLYVDAAELPGTFATLDFNESFCAGAKLYCSFWIVNLNSDSNTSDDNTATAYTRPNLIMILKTIDPTSGEETEVKRFYTGDIGYNNVSRWFQVGFEFTIDQSLSNEASDFRLEIINNGLGTMGNDFALDDIRVYRTNPAIKAVRTNDKFCLPDGNMITLEPLEMSVDVDFDQLKLTMGTNEETGTTVSDKLYFRFLMPDGGTTTDGSNIYDNFPGYKTDISVDPMYVNTDWHQPDANLDGYHYGMIQLSVFRYKADGTPLEYDALKEHLASGGELYAYVKKTDGTEEGNIKYKDMYIYRNGHGNNSIVFMQTIPDYVLQLEQDDEYNTGQYAIYVAEASGSLLTVECAGEAHFTIDFDKTDFELYVGGTVMGADGVLSACTNNTVDVKAYATAGASSDEETDLKQLFAIYDWYYGPGSTVGTVEGLTSCGATSGALANSASTFLRNASGVYKKDNKVLNWTGDSTYYLVKEDILFDNLPDAPVRNASGYNSWLATDQGKCWLVNDEDGAEWSWGQPNYVGYDMFGSRWRYTIPGYSYKTDEVTGFVEDYEGTNENNNMASLKKIPVDGVTSATMLGSSPGGTDNKATNIPRWGNKPVDFRTLKADLETYRFFFPYEPDQPTSNLTAWPVNPHNKTYVESINYLTGELTFAKIASDSEVRWQNSDPNGAYYIPEEEGRLTPEKYKDKTLDPTVADHAIHYVTNYLGKYIANVYGTRTELSAEDQKDPGTKGGVPYVRRYSSETGIEGFAKLNEGWEDEFEFWDLNNLIARMHYYEGKGILQLYEDRVDAEIGTLATVYMTVIPTSQVAFKVANLNFPTKDELTSANEIDICPTPSGLKLKASSWAPDIWYGETNSAGRPIMPYFNIEDVYQDGVGKVLLYEHIYTTRLPERSLDKTKPTQQFILPLLYFDEVKNAKVNLLEVIDEKGETKYSRPDDEIRSLDEVYIGLIDPSTGNKLLRENTIPHTSYYANPTTSIKEDGEEVESIITDANRGSFNVRWRIIDRDEDHALEAYPLVYNAYNYFIQGKENEEGFAELFNHDVELEGDPLPSDVMNAAFGFEDNKIGLEIMANNELLRNYVDVAEDKENWVNDVCHFRPGYTYLFELETTGGKIWGTEDVHSCDLVMKFQLKVVPDTIIWGGTNKILPLMTGETVEDDKYLPEWNRDGNWFIPTKDETTKKYTDQSSGYTTFPPLPETKVIIPAGSATYPTLEAYDNLSTEIGEKAYVGDRKIISMYPDQPIYEELDYYQTKITNPTSLRTTPWIEFDYNYVPNSCDTIHFKHKMDAPSAELGRQDLLNYNAAKVDLVISTMDWHGLSAPLRNMYSGDYMFKQANPITRTRLFNTTSPQSGTSFVGWTNPFNTTTTPLTAGLGYVVHVGEKFYTGTIADSGIATGQKKQQWTSAPFSFPNAATQFQFYDEITKAKLVGDIEPKEGSLDRSNSYRFVYEVDKTEAIRDDEGTTTIPNSSHVPENDPLVSVSIPENVGSDSKGVTEMVVGNPFMAHIDFEKFYFANQDFIKPEFKLITGKGGAQTITLSAEVEAEDGGKYLTNVKVTDNAGGAIEFGNEMIGLTSIAPMQTFIVTVKEGYEAKRGNSLILNRDMSVINTGANAVLRSSGEYNTLRMKVTAANGNTTNAVVTFSERSMNQFDHDEDSRRMIIEDVTNVPNIFTVADGMYLDINRMNDVPQSLPIGIIGGLNGDMKIAIKGFRSLDTDKDIFFMDTAKDLLELVENDSFEYSFKHDGTELGRFYLISKTKPTGTEEITKSNTSIYLKDRIIHILSLDGSELKDVTIYSADGQVLDKRINTGSTHLQIPASGYINPVLIVKSITDKTTQVQKVINQ
ncbi:hypothetical protein LJB91_02145 [Bacteroidales bacterium OttesenSCG-928-L03]|nr:hypothetical protein [Bacteroidales bacterium OttesenSCG-928-L03]